MPNFLEDLIIDRVDFVEEGANSAAFIQVFKRKEPGKSMTFEEILAKMKPEHAAVIQQTLESATEEVTKLRGDIEAANATIVEQNTKLGELTDELEKAKQPKMCSCGEPLGEDGKCGKCEKSAGFDETEVLKSMPEGLREAYVKMREQKEAAEEQVRKAAEEKQHAEAVAKAATLKALPVEQEVLVEIIKSNDQRVVDVLTTVATAIGDTVLGEVGKSASKSAENPDDAWAKIEAEADKVAKRDSVTKQKAIAVVIKEQPELYREYLNGGAM